MLKKIKFSFDADYETKEWKIYIKGSLDEKVL